MPADIPSLRPSIVASTSSAWSTQAARQMMAGRLSSTVESEKNVFVEHVAKCCRPHCEEQQQLSHRLPFQPSVMLFLGFWSSSRCSWHASILGRIGRGSSRPRGGRMWQVRYIGMGSRRYSVQRNYCLAWPARLVAFDQTAAMSLLFR
jgi:hypothetical protein